MVPLKNLDAQNFFGCTHILKNRDPITPLDWKSSLMVAFCLGRETMNVHMDIKVKGFCNAFVERTWHDVSK